MNESISASATLVPWLPIILQGFAFDVLISVLAMAIGTVAGLFLGLGQVSHRPPVRTVTRWITQFFRNAPWLVLLFFCIYLMPFELRCSARPFRSLPGSRAWWACRFR